MKIVFLHLTMGLAERGSEVAVDTVASALALTHKILVIQSGPVIKKPYQVQRVAPMDKASSPAPGNMLDKLLFRLHLDHESSRVLDFTRAAIPAITEFNPDIIVAINGPLQMRILQGQSSQAKLVAFGHAGIGYHDRDSIHAKPDLFVALTRQAEVWANKIALANTHVVYIPNPFDPARFNHGKSVALSLPAPVVMTISALSAYKNVDQVIKASQLAGASLLLIGDGEKSAAVTHLLSTYPYDFRWIKSLTHDEIPAYYRSAQVFCFVPDPQESFGMVYLEAMAAGLPVVASADPIRRDIIGKQGTYVDPHDPVEIAGGITQAMSLGKIDYSKALKQYQSQTVVKQIEKEFYALIK